MLVLMFVCAGFTYSRVVDPNNADVFWNSQTSQIMFSPGRTPLVFKTERGAGFPASRDRCVCVVLAVDVWAADCA